MTILEGAICPLGMITQAAQDYAYLKAEKISQNEYYNRHPEEIPELDPAEFTADTPENRKIEEWADRIIKNYPNIPRR